MGYRLASGHTERSRWHILPVHNGSEFREVQSYGIPDGHTLVRDVIGGDMEMVHGEGGNLPRAAEKTVPLPGLQIGTYRGFDDGAQTAYAWDRSGN